MRLVVEVGEHAAAITNNPFWYYPVRDEAHAAVVLDAFKTLELRACIEEP